MRGLIVALLVVWCPLLRADGKPAIPTLQLYQMVKDIHEVLTRNAIPYWIDGGTLLGAVRHRGLIPWDDDLDICVDRAYEQHLLNLKDFLATLGYRIEELGIYNGLKRILPIDDDKPWIDIQMMMPDEQSKKIFYVNQMDKDEHNNLIVPYRSKHYDWGRSGGPLYFTWDEAYPLKNYPFGETQLCGPCSPESYLTEFYGPQWRTHAKIQTYHDIFDIPYTDKELTDDDKQPAQPTGPLEERMAALVNDQQTR